MGVNLAKTMAEGDRVLPPGSAITVRLRMVEGVRYRADFRKRFNLGPAFVLLAGLPWNLPRRPDQLLLRNSRCLAPIRRLHRSHSHLPVQHAKTAKALGLV